MTEFLNTPITIEMLLWYLIGVGLYRSIKLFFIVAKLRMGS